LVFHIGQQKLKCPYCGTVREIDLDPESKIREQNFQVMLDFLAGQKQETVEIPLVRCDSCGSEVLFEGTLTSTKCPCCGSPIQKENVHRGGVRVPVDGVLPFRIEQQLAAEQLSKWVKSRWFAPNDFKEVTPESNFNGVYLPFWTFDSLTFTQYVGERGDHYTVTVGSGKDQRRETRTRWWPASGQFQRFFDDVLVKGTQELPSNHIENLAPWPLEETRPFTPEFLAGFFARTYDVDLKSAFDLARSKMELELRSDCSRRIGGDEQRLHQINSRYDAITYKHLLLPVWLLAYRYHDRLYRVFVNAVTGEVQGDRPYSWRKIIAAAVAVIMIAVTIFAAVRQ
jgi:predicted RNA-binding Zn-ribbon protein involved in translation (DUF1610 family)